MPSIIVGVDGSESSQHALEWALAEGHRTGTPVRVVHAWWAPPEYAAYPAIAMVDPAKQGAQMRRAGEELVDRMLIEAKKSTDGAEPEVHVEVVNEPPVQALLTRSAEAGRVVVGTRGRGGFRSLLLGSVSQQVLQHAQCPVVVVPRR